MIKLISKNEIKKLKYNLCFSKSQHKNFVVSSIYSKYIIIGAVYTGLTLAKKLTSVKYIFFIQASL